MAVNINWPTVTGNTGATPAPPAGVPDTLADLNQQLGMLDDELLLLEKRLSEVLRPQPPDGVDTQQPQPSRSQLADAIRLQSNYAHAMKQRVVRLNQYLDL